MFSEGTGQPADQMYTLEHKASSASHYHKENEDFSGGGR